MPAPLHQVRVLSRALVRAQRRRRRVEPAPGRDGLERLRALLAPDAVAEARLVDLPANRPPWTASGQRLAAGETVTTFATGRIGLSRVFDIRFGPGGQLWFRVGHRGPVFRGTRATHTFIAAAEGALELAAMGPGEWANQSGVLRTPPEVYRRLSGGLSVLVVRWAPGADSAAVLRAAAEADGSGLAASELARRAQEPREPEGWRHLWLLARSEI